MISEVLSVVDSLLNWSEKAGDRHKELFRTHVEETFNEMVLIHKDYRAQTIDAMITASRGEIGSDYIDGVFQNKVAFEPIRMKIHALGIAAKTDENLLLEIRKFLLACAKYLNVFFHERKAHSGRSDKEFDHAYSGHSRVSDPDDLEECYSAMYSGLLECLESYSEDQDIDLLKQRISNIDQLLLDRWSDVSVAYAAARLAAHS